MLVHWWSLTHVCQSQETNALHSMLMWGRLDGTVQYSNSKKAQLTLTVSSLCVQCLWHQWSLLTHSSRAKNLSTGRTHWQVLFWDHTSSTVSGIVDSQRRYKWENVKTGKIIKMMMSHVSTSHPGYKRLMKEYGLSTCHIHMEKEACSSDD